MYLFLSEEEKIYRRQIKIAEMKIALEDQEAKLTELKETFYDYADQAMKDDEVEYSDELLAMAIDMDCLIKDIRFIKMQIDVTDSLAYVAHQLRKLPDILRILSSSLVGIGNMKQTKKQIDKFMDVSATARYGIGAFRKTMGKVRDPKLRARFCKEHNMNEAEFKQKLANEQAKRAQRLARSRAMPNNDASVTVDIPNPKTTTSTDPFGGSGVDDMF